MSGHKKSQSAASDLTTGLHHELHPTMCLIVDTSEIFVSSCPRRFVDDQDFDVPCRSKSECGPTNGQAVDSPHNALTSNAFPDNALSMDNPSVSIFVRDEEKVSSSTELNVS